MSRALVIGGGLIGAGWAAAIGGAGIEVLVYDSGPGAAAWIDEVWATARPVMEKLGTLSPEAQAPRLIASPEDAAGVSFVQEALPEKLELKRQVLAVFEKIVAPDALIASSSSGFTAEEIGRDLARPERLLIGHPCNPPYLMPVVEIAAGPATTDEAMANARSFYETMGKTVLELQKPVAGHLVNRLQAAIWREAVNLVASGAASLADTERAVCEALAPRWCRLGPMSVFALAGAERGMAGFLDALGPQFQALWDDLGTPKLDTATCETLVSAYNEAELPPLADIAADRDANIPIILEMLARMNRQDGPGRLK